jgi:sec-independent protein translocase protein TatB
MFDIAPSEFMMVALAALIFIGPKDLPKVMRLVGYWVGRARGVARQFRSGFDAMVREAELEEMEKRWAKENERIMREHPAPAAAEEQDAAQHDATQAPVMVEQPHLAPAASDGPAVAADKAAS